VRTISGVGGVLALGARGLLPAAGEQDPPLQVGALDRDCFCFVEKAAQGRVLKDDPVQVLALGQPLVALLAAELLGLAILLQEPRVADQLVVDLRARACAAEAPRLATIAAISPASCVRLRPL
jgi:hypothetical protein